jgi:hypothetical protein
MIFKIIFLSIFTHLYASPGMILDYDSYKILNHCQLIFEENDSNVEESNVLFNVFKTTVNPIKIISHQVLSDDAESVGFQINVLTNFPEVIGFTFSTNYRNHDNSALQKGDTLLYHHLQRIKEIIPGNLVHPMEILPSGKFFAINFRKECVDNNLKTNKI